MNSTSTSTISTISTNYRQKGKAPSANSKVYKGFIHDATSKLSVGSIPAKFETIVYRNQSQKAFGSSNIRFQQEPNDRPGPQEYNFDHIYSITQNKALESLSQNGLGGFASKVERKVFENKYINSGPGPGYYQEASFFRDKNSSNNEKNSIQHTQLGQAMKEQSPNEVQQKVKIIYPGPGEYDPTLGRKVNTYNSSFISKSNRDNYLYRQEVPSPGYYNIKRDLQKKSIKHIGPAASFYPEIDLKKQESLQQRLTNFLADPAEKVARDQSPGPGHYDHKIPELLPEYTLKQELSSFKIQNKDRFGDPADKSKITKDILGPGFLTIKQKIISGIYDKAGCFDKIVEEKALVSGSAFMSESLRKPFGDYENRFGPNPVIPYILPKKKNFHLNLQRKWV